MTRYFTFSVFPRFDHRHQIVSCHIHNTRLVESYPFKDMQSVYSTAPADWVWNWSCMKISGETLTRSSYHYHFLNLTCTTRVTVKNLLRIIQNNYFLQYSFHCPSGTHLRFSFNNLLIDKFLKICLNYFRVVSYLKSNPWHKQVFQCYIIKVPKEKNSCFMSRFGGLGK